MKHIYALEANPSGVNACVIEEDGEIIDSLDEAFFGVRTQKDTIGGLTVFCEDFITYIQPDDEDYENMLDSDLYCMCREITLEHALKAALCYPGEDGSTTIDFLSKYFPEVKVGGLCG